MSIEYFVRHVYGRPTIYPSCDLAKKFAALLNQKTLSSGQLQQISEMGIECVQVPDPAAKVRA